MEPIYKRTSTVSKPGSLESTQAFILLIYKYILLWHEG